MKAGCSNSTLQQHLVGNATVEQSHKRLEGHNLWDINTVA